MIRPLAFVVLAAAFAFALRVGFTVAYRGGLDTVPVRSIAGADGVEYDLFARRVAAGQGYTWPGGAPTAFRAPGFPLALVVVYTLFGPSYPAAYLFFAACGAAGVVGTYLLARELGGERPGRWAAVFAAVYPPDVYDASYFFSELAYIPCLGFGLWLLVRGSRRESPGLTLIAGLLLGYAALTRSFALLLLPTFALYLLSRPTGGRRVAAALIYAAGFLLAVLPWTARNYLDLGYFVPVATNGGSTFYGANNDVVAGSWWQYGNWVATNRLPGRDLIEAQPDEVTHDKMEYKLGVEWVEAHPDKFAVLAVFKVVRFWLPFVHWTSFKVYPIANIGLTAPFLVLILIGLARTLAPAAGRRKYAVLHLTMLANLVMVVIFWGEPRFRDANLPVLMVYAVEGAFGLMGRSRWYPLD